MGEQTVDALLESKLIADSADLFSLTVDDIAGMPRFAQKSAEKLHQAIQGRKKVPLVRYIYGLGIRHVGAQTATDLAEHFGSLDKFRAAKLAELQDIEGIGTVVAQAISDWLGSERHQKLLSKLDKAKVEPVPVKRIHGKLTGQSFVITGTLEMGSREAAEERIKALGGKTQTAVTKDTTYLVVGEDPGGSKVAKANKLGTQQIDENKLKQLLEG